MSRNFSRQTVMGNRMNAQRPLLGTLPYSTANDKGNVRKSVGSEVDYLSSAAGRKVTTEENVHAIVPPFILSQDISRGLIYGVQVALEFTFMLAVMYVNLLFITSKILTFLSGHSKLGSSFRLSLV